MKGFEQLYGPLNATEDDRSPRDMDGHGTHTASTVAGRRVPNASAFGGFAEGTASGGAPLARLAIYKACWATPKASKAAGNTCFEADMLAAIDDAIRDGVHVLSISIGTNQPFAFNRDGIAIGALNAVKHNILVACSAGNSGPAPSSLSNPAPWLITVGAGSLDRDFVGPVVLGTGMEIIVSNFIIILFTVQCINIVITFSFLFFHFIFIANYITFVFLHLIDFREKQSLLTILRRCTH